MRLALSRVTESDLDEIIEGQYAAFADNPAHHALFGVDTPEARKAGRETHLKKMTGDASDCWIKVVDEDTGRIAAASNWRIHPTYVAPGESSEKKAKEDGEASGEKGEEPAAGYQPGTQEYAAHQVAVKDFIERRLRYTTGEGHIVLNILFVSPSYQRRGCGKMMVKWGCDLADQLLVPLWVEGSPAGKRLYESQGFVNLEDVATETKRWTVTYHMMKREAKRSIDLTTK